MERYRKYKKLYKFMFPIPTRYEKIEEQIREMAREGLILRRAIPFGIFVFEQLEPEYYDYTLASQRINDFYGNLYHTPEIDTLEDSEIFTEPIENSTRPHVISIGNSACVYGYKRENLNTKKLEENRKKRDENVKKSYGMLALWSAILTAIMLIGGYFMITQIPPESIKTYYTIYGIFSVLSGLSFLYSTYIFLTFKHKVSKNI